MSRLVPDPLLERVRQDPTAPALRSPSATWTREELLRAADGLATALAAEGVGQGSRVACLLADDAPAVALIHATRRLGAVHVPLNRRAASAELRAQLERVGVDTLLFDAAHAGQARDGAPEGLAGQRIEALLAGAPCGPPPVLRGEIDLEAAATIVFTSGTSGEPRAAILSYDNHRASAHAWAGFLRPRPGDRWLACLPLFHVAGLAIVTRATRWGAPLDLHPTFDAAAVSDALDDGVSHLSLVPAQLTQLLAVREARPVPGTLRAMLLGGGPIPADLLSGARAAGYPVLTTYGMTETGSGIAAGGADVATLADPLAARPLPGVAVRVEPDGAADGSGEILVRGEMVFSGYAGDDAATAARLQDGWLRTGDIGTLDGDGLLRVLDRRDDLIISGGENVSPVEVESVLRAHPGIADVAVVGLAHERWGAVPAAAIVVAVPPGPGDDELTIHCRARLADYKVPVRFQRLEALPRNALGKVLRRDLRRAFGDDTA